MACPGSENRPAPVVRFYTSERRPSLLLPEFEIQPCHLLHTESPACCGLSKHTSVPTDTIYLSTPVTEAMSKLWCSPLPRQVPPGCILAGCMGIASLHALVPSRLANAQCRRLAKVVSNFETHFRRKTICGVHLLLILVLSSSHLFFFITYFPFLPHLFSSILQRW